MYDAHVSNCHRQSIMLHDHTMHSGNTKGYPEKRSTVPACKTILGHITWLHM